MDNSNNNIDGIGSSTSSSDNKNNATKTIIGPPPPSKTIEPLDSYHQQQQKEQEQEQEQEQQCEEDTSEDDEKSLSKLPRNNSLMDAVESDESDDDDDDDDISDHDGQDENKNKDQESDMCHYQNEGKDLHNSQVPKTVAITTTTTRDVIMGNNSNNNINKSNTKKRRTDENQVKLPSKYHSSGGDSGWETFCRKGSRFKTFLDDAVTKVAMIDNSSSRSYRYGITDTTNYHGSNNYSNTNNNLDTPTTAITATTASSSNNNSPSMMSLVQIIAKDKTVESTLLQQQLEEAQAEIAAMTATNTELRQAVTDSKERLDRTTQALRIAGQNAANARADAEAAEATAATMATQLQAFSVVVDETKRASQVLYQEQEEITAAAELMENKFVKSKNDLEKCQRQRRDLEKQIEDNYKPTVQRLQQVNNNLETNITNQQIEATKWKQKFEESRRGKEKSQKRIAELEKELIQVQQLLVDATKRAADAESTVTMLKDTVRKSKDNSDKENQTTLSQNNDDDTNSRAPDTAATSSVRLSSKCSICLKDAVGIMKKCQCGSKSCGCRAHATCVNKIRAGPSVSHPCTPAQRLPVVLCLPAGAGATFLIKNSKGNTNNSSDNNNNENNKNGSTKKHRKSFLPSLSSKRKTTNKVPLLTIQKN